jgi:RHS repeat-associated protein
MHKKRTSHIVGTLICILAGAGFTLGTLRAEVLGSAPIEGDQGTFAGASLGTVDSATGTATASLPIALPPCRGGVQPSLALSYAHTRGLDIGGVGWSLTLPVIERRGIAGGPPRFDASDHFELSGVPLTEICTVPCAQESAPAWASGWRLYRPQVERVSTKVFSSADEHKETWRVLQTDGGYVEFGVPFGTSDKRALDKDRASQMPVRWNLVGQYDQHPNTRNVVRYVWKHVLPGESLDRARLTDIYYTAPLTGALTSKDEYAHHVHLDYEIWPATPHLYAPMAHRLPDSRLTRLAIASRGPDPNAPRQRVRVYAFAYHTTHMQMRGRPYLASVTLYGRCASTMYDEKPLGDDSDLWQLPPQNEACAAMPPTSFEYTEEARFDPVTGVFHGGVSPQELRLPADCPHAADKPLLAAAHVALADINRDGLADIVQSAYPGNPIFVNKPNVTTTAHRDFACGGLHLESPDSLFAPVQGLTVFGYWMEHSALALLRRSGNPVSYNDGFPKTLQLLMPTAPFNNIPQWLTATQPGPIGSVILPPPHLFGDLNNDGLSDAIYLETNSLGQPEKTKVAFSVRQANGTVAPFAAIIDPAKPNIYLGVAGSSWPAPKYAALADMNGDGLLDYVTTHAPWAAYGEFVYIPGRGDGTFGCENIPGNGCEPATGSPGANPNPAMTLTEVHLRSFPDDPPLPRLIQLEPPQGRNDIYFHDVNGDGRADIVRIIAGGLLTGVDIYLNLDGQTLRRVRIDLYSESGFTEPLRRLLFADMNGNGIDDIVLIRDVLPPGQGSSSQGKLHYIDLESFAGSLLGGRPAPGLLRRITHSGGATTEYEYTTVSSIEAGDQAGGATETWPAEPHDPMTGPWQYHAPLPLRVVSKITTTANAPVPYENWRQTRFAYREPVFDTWRGRFRGFRRVRTSVDINHVDVKYFFGGCLAPDGWEPMVPQALSTPLTRQCDVPEGHKLEALQGVPIQLEHLDSAGKYASTTRITYRVNDHSPATGPQLFVFPYAVDTFLYDTASYVSAPNVLPASIAIYDALTAGIATIPAAATIPDTVLPRAEAVRIRQRQWYDGHRNLVDLWDDGRVALTPFETPAPIDRPIHQQMKWDSIAALGVFRPTVHKTSYAGLGQVTPLVPDGPLREVQFEYDAIGRLAKLRAPLSGALALERWHAGGPGKAIAPEPATAAPNGTVLTLLELTYDSQGNVVKRQGADQQCERMMYLAPYQDLLETRETRLSGCNAPESLVTSFEFDRGLGALTALTDASQSRAVLSYDLLGRLAAVAGPHPTTPLATVPELALDYEPTLKGPLHWIKVTRTAPDVGTRTSWHFSNAFGQPVASLTQADPTAGDAAAWIAQPGPRLNQAGLPIFWYRPFFYAGPPQHFAGSTSGYAAAAWYEFGRVRGITRLLDGDAVILRRDYHALSVDTWDAENLVPGGPHAGAYARLTHDGHGRIVHLSKLGNAPAETRFDYLPTGELVALERRFTAENGTEHRYRRWRRFDSLGRVVENAEPNTASGFTPDPTAASGMKAWRYAYDKSGRLVGTRDARGCGKNLFYDGADRRIAEDYSPCLSTHAPYTAPILASGEGTEVLSRYDAQQLTAQPHAAASQGRLVARLDRGAETRYAYDGRHRTILSTRRIAKPEASLATLATRYTHHLYHVRTEFDGFDRVRKQSTGADAPALLAGGVSEMRPHYSARGLVTRIESSYGDLVTDVRMDADGFVRRVQYGDAAGTLAEMTPDGSRRLATYRLYRPAPGPWVSTGGYLPPVAGSPPTLQAELVHQQFHYNRVDAITRIEDLRDAQLWPSGAKPTSQQITHDAQYRVTEVQASHGGDAFVSPFAAELASADHSPVPQLSFAQRASHPRYVYDGFGNVIGQSELPNAIYDRGLSNVTIGHAAGKPNQLVSAHSGAAGKVYTHYAAAGNLVALDLERAAAQCQGPDGKCAQRFLYEWDEVNQLARVWRWDYTSLATILLYPAPPTGPAAVELQFSYSGGGRVLKRVLSATGDDRHVVDVFGSLRLNRTTYDDDAASNDYDASASRQQVYLAGLGKVIYAPGLPSTGTDRHVLLLFGDHLGSTSIAIDKDTSELVEYRGYQPYGATDYDYRPPRWQSFREDLHFTGKEEDIETGLTYFGVRYYSPYLQRFISADPLTVHAWGGDPNPYAYVGGRVFDATDPLGLDNGCLGAEQCPGGWGGSGFGGTIPIIQIPIDIGGGGAGRRRSAGSGSPVYHSWYPPMPPPPLPPPPGLYASGPQYAAAANLWSSWWTAPGYMGGGMFAAGPRRFFNTLDVIRGWSNAAVDLLTESALTHLPVTGPILKQLQSDLSFRCNSGECAAGKMIGTLSLTLGVGEMGAVEAGMESGMASAVSEIEELGAGSGRGYSVLFEHQMQLPNAIGEGTREFHNMLANEALRAAMAEDPVLAAAVRRFIPDLWASGRVTGAPGAAWTWNHAPERGLLQLVPRVQHTPSSPAWEILHPFPTSVSPAGRGGFSEWGHLY